VAKCAKCGRQAVIRIPYARMWLCKDHFIEFFETRVLKAIRRYGLAKKGDRVLVTVSGGKDSAALLSAMKRAGEELGFGIIALHIDLGIGEYSRRNREAVKRLAAQLGTKLLVFDVKEVLGMSIPEMAFMSRRPPCSVCGLVKRYVINAAAVELGVDAVALGHNMDDMIAYIMKAFITQDISNIHKLGPRTESLKGAVGRIRPLYDTSEREALAYALMKGLSFNHAECPNAAPESIEREVKAFMSSLERNHPSIKVQLVRRFYKNLVSGGYRGGGETSVSRCPVCGLISDGGVCSFCRLTKKLIGRYGGPIVREWFSKAGKGL